jgi:transcriptional regulator with XRE-family HTH domain
MNICGAIKSIRIKMQLTQKQLAAKCNITQSYLSCIENNKKIPNFNIIEQIGKQISVPIPILLFLSIGIEDVKESKKEIYKYLKPTIDKFISDIFFEKEAK